MNRMLRKKLAFVDALSGIDKEYNEMMRQCAALEKRFDAMVAELPQEQQELAWDFIMLCENMSYRKLQLACTYLALIPEE